MNKLIIMASMLMMGYIFSLTEFNHIDVFAYVFVLSLRDWLIKIEFQNHQYDERSAIKLVPMKNQQSHKTYWCGENSQIYLEFIPVREIDQVYQNSLMLLKFISVIKLSLFVWCKLILVMTNENT